MKQLTLSVELLTGSYHGMKDKGEPEWPPSPLRLFQALLAVACRKFGDPLPTNLSKSLDWLASLAPPAIGAPEVVQSIPFTTSVPNNAMDICARAWSKGSFASKDSKPSTHKAMKTICHHFVANEQLDGTTVRYVWSFDADRSDAMKYAKEIVSLIKHIYCLGWGLDHVAGFGKVEDTNALSEIESPNWSVGEFANQLRTPNSMTRQALHKRHQQFINRLEGGNPAAVPTIPPSTYSTTGYGRAFDAVKLPFQVFNLISSDNNSSKTFDFRKGCEVAGMMRHLVGEAAKRSGWTEEKTSRLVFGHGQKRGQPHESVNLARFAYVALPSLQPKTRGGRADHVGLTRRVLVYVPTPGYTKEVHWLMRALTGCDLVSNKTGKRTAMLAAAPQADSVIQRYSPDAGASQWSTVTPVVLPGNYFRRTDVSRLKRATGKEKQQLLDDRENRIDKLLRKAIVQAGHSKSLAKHAKLDWRTIGYLPGADRVDRYFVPDHLRKKFPALHVRIRWCDPQGNPVNVFGPIVIGAGRFYGLGLFASETH